ncbi:hypothetical protein T01_2410 [Trichinella spiralis]|uniref:Uncharacterized protein n=1 Tax=Trichinella spiralis TaxID=6334 RepID=A0A0V1BSR6_TRISP|nr:hypothetical protein T01_2410 [Trichinella spiralis]
MTSSSLFSYIWPMRYLIFLCASGTTLGDGVRESTYLAWYLVQDQEDEFQFAAAVFCQTFALQAASQIRLLSWSNGNNVSVDVFYQGVAHEPVVHGDVSSSSDYCRAKPFDDCCGRGVHLMRPFILLAYINLHFGNFLTKVSNTIRIAASLSCRFRSERVAWSSKRKQRSRKRSRWRDIVEEKISTPVPSVLYTSHRLSRLL